MRRTFGLGANRDLWSAVDRLIDAAPTLADLFEHRLHLLAGRRWQTLGRDVPPEIVHAERRAGLMHLALAPLLAKIRAVYPQPMILLKGAEVAARYPDPTLRPFGDIDLLVEDAPAAHAALRRAGFNEIGDPRLFVDIHHLRPLQWQMLPLVVEIHSAPKWLDGMTPPSVDELFAVAVPARVDGIDSVPAAHHAVLLAVHSWAHEPLRHLLDLIDVATMADEADPRAIRALAQVWGVERVWKTTERAIDALFYGARRPFALRLWARNIASARGRTVLESHLENWFAPFGTLRFQQAVRVSAANIASEVRPKYGEPWTRQLMRVRLALRNARTRRSVHDDVLREKGLPLSPFDVTDEDR